MATKVVLKKSSVVGKIPVVGDLAYGEFAINYADEKLYFKNASNVIKSFGTGGSAGILVTNKRYHYIFTTSTTVITGADENGETLLVDPDNVFVFLNGAKLIHGDDYTVNAAGTSITLVAAAVSTDEIEIQSLGSTSVLVIEDAQSLGLIHSIQASHRLITTSTTANQIICALPIATFQSCKYIVSAKEGTNVHMTEISAIHNGTNVYVTESNEIISNTSVGTFSVDINSGNMRLLVTPSTTGSTIFTVHRTGIET